MSTPFDPEESPRRSALEPTNVLRRRQPGSLADLLRQVQEQEREREPEEDYEVVAVPAAEVGAVAGPAAEGVGEPWVTEDDTQELPPVVEGDSKPAPRGRPAGKGPAHGRSTFVRSTVLGVAATLAALGGFSAALLLTWDRDTDEAAQAPPPAASSAPPSAAPAPPGPGGVDPDGPGTLREGDRGPAVSDLQQRLLRIPDVYKEGTPSGVYDATLTAAVARFQLWYGIRGDETGVYGNDTRSDLEARTAS
ncbi:peptidoglycan-binding protein [Streptomyces sp. NPDC057620]|uniref:Peptidoglycan-binding protein n=1 Tax=Streptomyces liliiviolaceus TaxID=2823109 RepID=A0A941B8I1_9ACTN|nr:peptidoglycan-binding domain-containing protein [Streptomyces liliiviolaceus]MBQ0851606.1 peptidoglycan-binding protein [Streptomyces liliiviolaceus]